MEGFLKVKNLFELGTRTLYLPTSVTSFPDLSICPSDPYHLENLIKNGIILRERWSHYDYRDESQNCQNCNNSMKVHLSNPSIYLSDLNWCIVVNIVYVIVYVDNHIVYIEYIMHVWIWNKSYLIVAHRWL